MDIPWVAIIMAILSFVGAKKSGATNAQAAAIGAGVGIGSYYLFDPSNKDNLFGVGDAADAVNKDKDPKTLDTSNGGAATTGAGFGQGLKDLASQTIDTTGKTLQSWGPAGTAGVVATGAAVSSDDSKKWLMYGALALGALFLIK